MPDFKIQTAELLLRCFAGILFLFQGYDKLFRVKMPVVIDTFMNDASRYHVPRYLVAIIAYYTSVVEFFGGILLVLGLFTNMALYALGLDLLLVCFAFSVIDPMWDLKYMFPRLILLVLLLILPESDVKWGLDSILNHN